MNQLEIQVYGWRISIREYNDLRDQKESKYITDPSLISIIDKIEELTM